MLSLAFAEGLVTFLVCMSDWMESIFTLGLLYLLHQRSLLLVSDRSLKFKRSHFIWVSESQVKLRVSQTHVFCLRLELELGLGFGLGLGLTLVLGLGLGLLVIFFQVKHFDLWLIDIQSQCAQLILKIPELKGELQGKNKLVSAV